jgi:hypothetical protein
MGERALSQAEQALALATKRAVQAAGGLQVCESETGTSDSQLSRCCSPRERDSITIRDAVTIDAIGHGGEGHPFILRALARQLGFVVVQLPSTEIDPQGMNRAVTRIARELGHVANEITEAEADGLFEPHEAQAVLREIEHLETETAALRLALERLAASKEGVRI